MKRLFGVFVLACILGCNRGPGESASLPPDPVAVSQNDDSNDHQQARQQDIREENEDTKNSGGINGLEKAKRDVVKFKTKLRRLDSEQLIAAFIPTRQKEYGEYEYYYKYMANIAIQDEISSRGNEVVPALNAYVHDQTRIWEAINGPGLTIGQICQLELQKQPGQNRSIKPKMIVCIWIQQYFPSDPESVRDCLVNAIEKVAKHPESETATQLDS